MNDELKLGYILEVEDSNPPFTNSETTSTAKRKAEDDSTLLHKKKSILKGMKATELHAILQKDPIAFCQEVGLLPNSVKCYCNNDMKLEITGRIHKRSEWVCRKKDHVKKHPLRKGTWFENSRLSMPDMLWIMYMWLYRYSTGLMLHECNNGPNSIIGVNKKCLEACQLILEIKHDPLGGEQKIVEIFECKFNNEKLELKEPEDSEKWVFCALEQDSTKSLLIIVEDKTSDCLLQLFSKYILPGTTIVSLFWSPYKNLTKKDFVYLTKQRSLTFYHSTTKVRMDTFKEFVTGVNRHQPLTHLVKNEYEVSFFEKMYRKSLSNASDAYIGFLKDIAMVYKPLVVAVKLEPKTETIDD